MNGLLDVVRSDLDFVLQSTPKSLPPPRCLCGWGSEGGGAGVLQKRLKGKGVASEWSFYVSALKALSLLPSAPRVGTTLARGVSAALEAAACQVVCAFIPAEASAFAQLSSSRDAFAKTEKNVSPSSASRHFTEQPLRRLVEAVPAADAFVCLATLLSALWELIAGSEELMHWHGDTASELFREGTFPEERGHFQGCADTREFSASVEAEALSSYGPCKAGHDDKCKEGSAAAGGRSCKARLASLIRVGNHGVEENAQTKTDSTHQLAASVAQRLSRLPSNMRFALFLLTVRRQFRRQSRSLWEHAQRIVGQVLEALALCAPLHLHRTLSLEASALETEGQVQRCVAVSQAVLLFRALGEGEAQVDVAPAEERLAAQAREAVSALRQMSQSSFSKDAFSSSSSGPSSARALHLALKATDASFAAVLKDAEEAALGAERILTEPWKPRPWPPQNPQNQKSEFSVASQAPLLTALEKALLRAVQTLCAKQRELLIVKSQKESWVRVPVRRSFPLVVLRSPPRISYEALVLERRQEALLAESAVSSSSCTAPASDTRRRSSGHWEKVAGVQGPRRSSGRNFEECGKCGRRVRPQPWNPFSGWRAQPVASEGIDPRFFALANAEPQDVRCIDEELSFVRRIQTADATAAALPVVTALSESAAKQLMQLWCLACSAPPSSSVCAVCVEKMLKVASFYTAIAAVASLPPAILSCLFETPQKGAAAVEGLSRNQLFRAADDALLRRHVPHLCELLVREEEETRRRGSCLGAVAAAPQQANSAEKSSGAAKEFPSALRSLVPALAKLSSPGSLWGLAERVAAVESAVELSHSLHRQLSLHGLLASGGETQEAAGAKGPCSTLGDSEGVLQLRLSRAQRVAVAEQSRVLLCAVQELRAVAYRSAAGDLCQSAGFVNSVAAAAGAAFADKAPSSSQESAAQKSVSPAAVSLTTQHRRRQLQDLFWRVRCAGGGSLSASSQLRLWKAVRSQCVIDAMEALSCAPLPSDSTDKALRSGPLVAFAEALRAVIQEASLLVGKAAQAAKARASASDAHSQRKVSDDGGGGDVLGISDATPREGGALDLEERDFDAFLEAISLSATETLRWCSRCWSGRDGRRSLLPLRVLSNALLRLENANLLRRGAAAEFEATHASLLRQKS